MGEISESARFLKLYLLSGIKGSQMSVQDWNTYLGGGSLDQRRLTNVCNFVEITVYAYA